MKQEALLCSRTCPQSNKNMLELVIQCDERGQRKTACFLKDKNSSHSGKRDHFGELSITTAMAASILCSDLLIFFEVKPFIF